VLTKNCFSKRRKKERNDATELIMPNKRTYAKITMKNERRIEIIANEELVVK
jgi:16S rRNA A1518/A1519 N6-dimethyltransferase RsmA/KsgA/DIM1 with predicted DNA glycosylase/AP lyase activity